MAGWIVEEFNLPNVLEIVYGNYRIVYDYNGERVLILTVFHGSHTLRDDVLRDI